MPEYSKKQKFNDKANIAYIKETLEDSRIDSEIKEKIKNVLDFLKSEGHNVEAIEYPHLDFVLPTYYILTTAEASSNLSRYDGVRYGFRSQNTNDL